MSSSKKIICSSLNCCVDLVGLIFLLILRIHLFGNLNTYFLFPSVVKSISLLSSSTKYMLRFSQSFNDFVVKGKQK